MERIFDPQLEISRIPLLQVLKNFRANRKRNEIYRTPSIRTRSMEECALTEGMANRVAVPNGPFVFGTASRFPWSWMFLPGGMHPTIDHSELFSMRPVGSKPLGLSYTFVVSRAYRVVESQLEEIQRAYPQFHTEPFPYGPFPRYEGPGAKAHNAHLVVFGGSGVDMEQALKFARSIPPECYRNFEKEGPDEMKRFIRKYNRELRDSYKSKEK